MSGKIEAILIDGDGCIVHTENGEKPVDYYEGLKILSSYVQLANKGLFPQISLCTGRDRNYVEAVSSFIGLPNFWSIIESGIALFNAETKEILLNPALTHEVEKAFREEISGKRIPKILKEHPGFFLYPGNQINIALERVNGFNVPIEECYEIVRKELQDLVEKGLVIIHHSKSAVDISPSKIDKASGTKFFCRKTRITREKILGIGDSRNDFPLFNSVDFAGCPSNASVECKSLVRKKLGYISPLPYVMGVTDIIRHFKPWM